MQTINTRRTMGVLIVVASICQGCATSNNTNTGDEPVMAAAKSAHSSYVADSGQQMVMSTQELCVRTINWSADNTMSECDGVVAAPKAPGSALIAYNGRALFEFDSANLTNAGQAELNRLTAKLNAQDKIKSIEIVGHADSVGTDMYNQKLSERRAESVKSYLQRSLQNVAVTAKGMGESSPVADNGTDSGRNLNRRVDVNIAAMVEQ